MKARHHPESKGQAREVSAWESWRGEVPVAECICGGRGKGVNGGRKGWGCMGERKEGYRGGGKGSVGGEEKGVKGGGERKGRRGWIGKGVDERREGRGGRGEKEFGIVGEGERERIKG